MWARIENGLVAELTDIDPEGRYHPSWIWHACADDVACGWSFADGVFSAPVGGSGEDQAANERFWRDGELAANEWMVNRHRDELEMGDPTSLSDEQYSELLVYRKQLRDWPENPSFPDSNQRPVAPDWLAGQIQ